jgi:hypothetical protein
MRRTVLRLLLSIVSILLGLTAAEIGLRVAGIAPPEVRSYDPVRGWQLRPGAIGLQRSEGHARVTINGGGFRGPEVPIDGPRGVLRIAVLGDSFTEAMHVPYDETFCAVIERELASCPLGGQRAQVLDFGVSGYGTGQELLTLRQQVWRYAPDIVILAFFAGNDVSDNSAALDSESWLNGEKCRPHYTVHNGALAENDQFRERPAASLWCRSVFALNRIAIMDYLGEPAVLLHRLTSGSKPTAKVAGHEPGLDDEIYGPPPNTRWRDAWTVTEDLIIAMSRDVKAHDARLVVVTLSTPIQVYPDAAYREAYLHRVGGTDLFYPERRLDALGAREGFVVLNLAPSLQAYADQHHSFLHGFPNTQAGTGHWNELGHRLAGELIAQRLCNLLRKAAPPGDSMSVGPKHQPTGHD